MNRQSKGPRAVASDQYTAGHSGEDHLALALGDLARDLQREPPEDMLAAIVAAAVDLVPGVEDASVSVVLKRKEATSEAPTSDLPAKLDAIQMEEGQGPCLDAAFEQQTFRVPDLQAETRWPTFCRRAIAETPVRGMLAFRFFVEDENFGALNLFSRQPNVFTDESEYAGSLVAAHAAVAYAESRRAVQLTEAITSRDLIGQAKGILMERYKITGQEAFYLLSQASSRTNTKLVTLAEHLATSGELPTGQNS